MFCYRCRHKDTDLCNSCARQSNLIDHYSEYKPTCRYGYTDCILDPAYIQKNHPDWYDKLYKGSEPSQTVCAGCVDGDQYDDEDK